MSKLEAGDKAPAFKGKDQDGNTVSLSDFKGKKLVLYFYPEDDTPTCTDTACNLRDNYAALKKKGFAIVGVSPDSMESHGNFIQKFKLPFPLLADPDKKIIEAYDAWGEKNMYGNKFMGLLRKTYLINEEGVIEHIFKKVDAKNHTEQILSKVKQ